MTTRREPPKVVKGTLTFFGVYHELKGDVMQYAGRGWNEETTAQYDSIIINHIVPALKGHDYKPIFAYTLSEFEAALTSIKRQGKRTGKGGFVPWEQSTLEKFRYLMEAVISAAARNCLCMNFFQERDGALAVGGAHNRNFYRLGRTPKSLSVEEDVKLARYLSEHAEMEGEAAGLRLMHATGVRDNEACGANFEDVHAFVEYPGHFYLIVSQTTEIGSDTLKINGKTYNSPRKIPLANSLYEALMEIKKERLMLASANGYTGDGGDLPIACKKENPVRRCKTSDLSNAARRVFVAIGMREEDLDSMGRELKLHAQLASEKGEGDEFKGIEADPTAYLLRRNFATNAAILGLSDVEIQYIMGHKISSPYFQRRDFNNEKRLFAIKEKLDRRPFLHVGARDEIVVETRYEEVLIPRSNKVLIRIPAVGNKRIRITATAREPRDYIKMRVACDIHSVVHSEIESYSTPLPSEPSRTIDVTRGYQDAFRKTLEEKIKKLTN